MTAKQAKIIGEFLRENPEFCKAEWDSNYEDLTVWFKNNPQEPYSISEFIKNTPTWILLKKFTNDLRSCE